MQRRNIEDMARITVCRIMTDKKVNSFTRKMAEYDDILFLHCQNVAFMVAQICIQNKFPEEELYRYTTAALLHDVGKLKVPKEILSKAGTLSLEEFSIVKAHVEEGVALLREAGFEEKIIECVATHHERMDGDGYPNGLKKKDIPTGGALIAAVDEYDAMTAKRTYGKEFSAYAAISTLEYEKGISQVYIRYLKSCMAL